jgi:hypothetical protein
MVVKKKKMARERYLGVILRRTCSVSKSSDFSDVLSSNEKQKKNRNVRRVSSKRKSSSSVSGGIVGSFTGVIRLLKTMKINQCKQGDQRKRKARSLKPVVSTHEDLLSGASSLSRGACKKKGL